MKSELSRDFVGRKEHTRGSQPIVVVIALALILSTMPTEVQAKPLMQGNYRIASSISPYYGWDFLSYEWGAIFTGSSGHAQQYWGIGGYGVTCLSGSGCIDVWGWVGPTYNYLQLPKRWLYVVGGSTSWIPGNYSAYLY